MVKQYFEILLPQFKDRSAVIDTQKQKPASFLEICK